MSSSMSRRLTPVALVAVLLVGACTGTEPATSPETETDSPSAASLSPSPPESADPTSSPDPTTDAGPVELPGDKVETAVSKGQLLVVMGVEYDQTLDLRVSPEPDAEVAGGVGPLSDVTATGASRRVGDTGIWHEVRAGDMTGWAPAGSLAWRGETVDETSAMVRSLNRRPKGEDMLDLGRKIARASSYNDPTSGAKVSVTSAPTDGDPGQVTVDITGVPDDSVVGVRLSVFGSPNDDGGYTVKTVELTYLCGRGVDKRGFCV